MYVHTHLNMIMENGDIIRLTSSEIIQHIRRTVNVIGVCTLGFTGPECGTHSIRSSMTMQMYLDRLPIYTIMLQGRWSSDAFLLYIRQQVQQFSTGLSSSMIQKEEFFTVP